MFVNMRVSLPPKAVLCLAILGLELLSLTGSAPTSAFTLLRPEVVLLVSALLFAPGANRESRRAPGSEKVRNA